MVTCKAADPGLLAVYLFRCFIFSHTEEREPPVFCYKWAHSIAFSLPKKGAGIYSVLVGGYEEKKVFGLLCYSSTKGLSKVKRNDFFTISGLKQVSFSKCGSGK